MDGIDYDGGSDNIYVLVTCPSCQKPTRMLDWEDDCQHCETLLTLRVEIKRSINIMGENDNASS